MEDSLKMQLNTTFTALRNNTLRNKKNNKATLRRQRIQLFFLFLYSLVCFLKCTRRLELTPKARVETQFRSSVFMAFPGVSYEYLLSEDLTIGAAVGLDSTQKIVMATASELHHF